MLALFMVPAFLIGALVAGVLASLVLGAGLRRYRGDYESALGPRYASVVATGAALSAGAIVAAIVSTTVGFATVGAGGVVDSGYWTAGLGFLAVAVGGIVVVTLAAALGVLQHGTDPETAPDREP